MRPRLTSVKFAAPLAIVAAIAAAASISAASASPSGPAPTVPLLKAGIQYAITSFNPASNGTLYQADGLSLEGLVRLTAGGQLQPALATSWSQPSQATYVFHLRHGVKFWDGNEMTSADVAGSYNYYRYPGLGLAGSFLTVKNIKATDKYTVVVTLRHPDASFLATIGLAPGVFEYAFFDAHKTTFGQPGTLIMGTGPWEVVSLDPTSGAEFSANPHYWGGRVPIQHISLRWYASETSEALALRAGDIDVAFPLDPKAFAATSGAQIVSPQQGIFPHVLAMEDVAPPWNDIHVRRAVAYAVNRADLIQAFNGPATPLNTIIPPAQLYHIAPRATVDKLLKSLPSYSFDLTKARQEMAASAFPNGFTADFNTLQASFGNESQVLAAQLAKIGITLNVNYVSVGAWFRILRGTDRAKVGIQLNSPGTASPDPSYEVNALLGSAKLHGGRDNLSTWEPADVDTLITNGLTTLNPLKRLAIYGQILKRVADDVAYIPLINAPQTFATSGKFKWPGFSFNYYAGPWALGIVPSH